jgi:hypothetical protein
VVATLADIFRHQGRSEIVEIVESAHAYFEETNYDNWNGGTYTWSLRLEIPVHIFASVEPRLEAVEREIGGKLSYLNRQYSNDVFGDVTITPVSRNAMPIGMRMPPSDIDIRRLWPEGRFRLFLSHVSADRIAVSHLKEALGLRGVAAFVAHEDIEPSLEWQREIELALRSMHGLAALITPMFHGSLWTDHEVGWALGRGVLVVPVRLGADPYGLMGKIQGVRGTLKRPNALAELLARTLLKNPQTHGEMQRAVVRSFASATSNQMALALSRLLVEAVPEVAEEDAGRLRQACSENPHVAGADGVAKAIYAKFGRSRAVADVPPDDDIPF